MSMALCLCATASALPCQSIFISHFEFFGLAFVFSGLVAALVTALWTVMDIK